MARKLLVLNWKMNPETLREAQALFLGARRALRGTSSVGLVVCPPTVFLSSLGKGRDGDVVLGAQDVFWEIEGAHTGSISPYMLRDVGVRSVIVGHSERRALGESDATVSRKVRATLAAKLIPIVCVGEHVRDEKGDYLGFLAHQITESLKGVGRTNAKNIIIAYEPLWAIGKTYQAAVDPHSLHEITLFIRKILAKSFGRSAAMQVKILYGGSVEPENAEPLLHGTGVAGFLVGHASLDMQKLKAIIRSIA